MDLPTAAKVVASAAENWRDRLVERTALTEPDRINEALPIIRQLQEVRTPSTVYEPWTDGHAVGFKATRLADGKVLYVYLNPSVDEDGPESTPDMFVYIGTEGDASQDEALQHYDIAHDAWND